MNLWSKRSLELAQNKDYLDRLQEIYRVSPPKPREIPQAVLDVIKKALAAKDKDKLINILLDLKRFPYDESYAKFLRSDRKAIARNPKTVNRICQILFKMGEDGIMAGITASKKANQQRGNEFRAWAQAKFKFMGLEAFKASKRGIAFLDASDTAVRDYANSVLDAGLRKRPDFVSKSDGIHVVGEAKFLADEGGNQRGAFRDALEVAGRSSKRAYMAAVLDGVVWIKNSSFCKTIETSSLNIFSALLLEDFLLSLKKP